jgi:hypothetical protein
MAVKTFAMAALIMAFVFGGISFLCFSELAKIGCILCIAATVISQKFFPENDD